MTYIAYIPHIVKLIFKAYIKNQSNMFFIHLFFKYIKISINIIKKKQNNKQTNKQEKLLKEVCER